LVNIKETFLGKSFVHPISYLVYPDNVKEEFLKKKEEANK
jgi:hypothetical protein